MPYTAAPLAGHLYNRHAIHNNLADIRIFGTELHRNLLRHILLAQPIEEPVFYLLIVPNDRDLSEQDDAAVKL